MIPIKKNDKDKYQEIPNKNFEEIKLLIVSKVFVLGQLQI